MNRTIYAAIATFSLVGLLRADELSDTQAKLKESVAQKNADAVLADAQQVFKLAKVEMAKPQPSDASEVDNWKQHVEYAKEVMAYGEYALSATAEQGVEPAKAVALVDALIAENPKSKYLDESCASAYYAALGKTGGAAKQVEGMAKFEKGHPDDLVALTALAADLMSKSPDRALAYANRLVSEAKSKAKPEGYPEAEWERIKTSGLGTAYFVSGVIYGSKSSWVECDRELRAAVPSLQGDKYRLGIAYYYLGVANYQLGHSTLDRTRIQTGLRYSQQSAALPGPMQNQAYHNVNAIQNELQGRH